MDRSTPSSSSAIGGAVSGTRKVVASVATRLSSGSSPTIRAKAGEDVAAQPVAKITTPAVMPGSSPSGRTTAQASTGQASSRNATMAATRTGRRRCAKVPARSTRSSTSVIIASTTGVTTPLHAAASPGDSTPPKMPTASSTDPRRADSASRWSGMDSPPGRRGPDGSRSSGPDGTRPFGLAAFGTCSMISGMCFIVPAP